MFCKKKKLFFMLGMLLMLLVFPVQCHAETIFQTDVTSPRANCFLAGIEGSYIADIQNALDRINEIRKEACKEGVWDPRNSSRKLTLSDYVPIKWSSDLEYIARIRAAESSIYFEHERLTGASWSGISSPNGVGSTGEVLASVWQANMVAGINAWYTEKADWVNQKKNVVIGHYTAMINPSNRYVGLGCFESEDAAWGISVAGEFLPGWYALDETRGTSVSNCVQMLEISNSYLKSMELTGSTGIQTGEKTTLKLKGNLEIPCFGYLTKSKVKIMDGITWQSSNPSVASVDQNGKITGISAGSTTITAKTSDGKTASKKLTVTGKAEIQASNKKVVYGSKAFSLNAKTNSNGKLTYKTSDSNVVTVNSNGKVTIKGCGKATITVTVSATAAYKGASKKVTITVLPKQMKIAAPKSQKKGTLLEKWTKDSKASGYRLWISTDSKFKSGRIQKLYGTQTTSAQLTGLKSGKTYYVKMQSYKKYNGKYYYGKWSSVKKVKVK